MELVEDSKEVLVETAKPLKGSTRQVFTVRTIHAGGEKEVSDWQNGSRAGITGRSAKVNMNWSMRSPASMHSGCGGAQTQ